MQDLFNHDLSLSPKKILLFILCIGSIVYVNNLGNAFVYDDILQISENPLTHSLTNIHYFFMGGTFFDAATGQIANIFYRPMSSLFFTLLYTTGGGQPFIFHLFQLLLHMTNTYLVYLFLHKFFKSPLALFLSLVFLVHPINQESVSYISNLQEILFFFFGMSALLLTTQINLTKQKIIFLNMLLFFSLLSKETAIVFIPIIFFYTYFWQKKSFTPFYFLSILFTTLFYLYLRFFVVHVTPIINAIAPMMKATLAERITTIPSLIFYYLKTFFYPNDLALGHAWVVTTLDATNFYLPLFFDFIFFAIIFFIGAMFKKTNSKMFLPYLLFTLWFILGLVLHLQIIPLEITVADRWFYFPIIGLLGIIGTIFSFNWAKKINNNALILAGSIILLILSLRTMIRNTNWNTMATLCQNDLQIIPNSYSVQSVCASEFFKRGNYEEAKKHYQKATTLAPNWGSNWYEYGLTYEYTNNLTKAREYYKKSIQLNKEVNAYVSLASTYLTYEKDPEKAKKFIEEGLTSYPNYQRLQLYLAVCEDRLHNKQKAIEIATNAHQKFPTPESLYVLTQITNNQEVKLQ
jgi:protein O-mannosyl-transferase